METQPCQISSLRRMVLPGIIAWVAVGAGLAVLSGWTWNIDCLKRILPGLVAMNPTTAVAFIFSGISLWLQRSAFPGKAPALGQRAAPCLAVAVTCVGLLRLAGGTFGWEHGVDRLLFTDTLLHDGAPPDRMSPHTAAGLWALGLALLSLDMKTRNGRRPAEWFAILTLFISLLALIGHAYQVEWLYGLASSIPMALHTAAVLHLLALGILFSRMDEGVMEVLTGGSSGGALARRMFAILVPLLVVLGWLCLAGMRRHYYEPDLGVTLHTLASIGILGSFIWWSARSLHHADTIRQQADQALRESEERARWSSRFLDSVIENLPAMIFVKDAADLHYVRVNRVMEDLTGISRQDFLTKTDSELYPADEALFFAQKDREIVAGGRMVDIPVEPIHSVTRGTRLLHTRKVPIFDEAGCVKYILGISEDITARIAAEREIQQLNETLELRVQERTTALAATESKFRTLVEQSLVGIYIIQGDRFVYTNPKMSEICGHTEEELLARPVTDFIVEEDRPVTAENIRMRLEGAAHQIRYHLRMKHKNGSVVHVEAHGTRSDSHARPTIIGTLLDITERKHAEERLVSERNLLRALIDHLPGYIFVKDPARRYLLSNRAHTRLLGAEAESELIGRTVFDFFAEEKARRFDEDDQRLLQGGVPVLEREEQFETDGVCGWRSTTKVLSRDAQGKIVSIVGIQHDITERRRTQEEIRVLNTQLEERVRERTSQLEAANKELEAFSYSVSHDLRAPLRHVQGYVEMLEQSAGGQLSEKARRYLKTIKDSSTDMGQLIDDLLEFSRMGRVAFSESSIQMEALARSTIQSLELAVQNRSIEWKISPLPKVLGDPAALKQVMANLIGNAVKYTRKRDAAEIEIGCAGEEEGRLVLFVKDNGAGFDMKYSHKLFGVFQRLHRAEDFEGTGIGLATVQRVIGRHGGRAWAEGAPDHGATIYFTLKPAPAPALAS